MWSETGGPLRWNTTLIDFWENNCQKGLGKKSSTLDWKYGSTKNETAWTKVAILLKSTWLYLQGTSEQMKIAFCLQSTLCFYVFITRSFVNCINKIQAGLKTSVSRYSVVTFEDLRILQFFGMNYAKVMFTCHATSFTLAIYIYVIPFRAESIKT